ncbi:MAG: hypothetical protein LC117_07780 [Bacteroidia bacterium]|nr:hypothetical protein [Bacteroidia bacterium]MCZ2277810.1 hypothetical protein [Bacteroidia bacterium]
MSIKQRVKQKQKLSALTKGVMVAAGGSILGLMLYFTVFFNSADVEVSKAEEHARSMMGYEVGDGEVIAFFNWEHQNPLTSESGLNAIAVSKAAEVTNSGKNDSYGLSPKGKELNLKLSKSQQFNTEGIDISFDFRRLEDNCDFYSRGNYFNFGMKDGKILIAYKVTDVDGQTSQIKEVTRYEIPKDQEFRTYRFTYDPRQGKAEIMVNGITVWSHSGTEQAALSWKTSDQVIIGRGMKGDASSLAVLDNLMVRSTRNVNRMPIHLLSFEAKAENDYVMVRWFTAKEIETDTFVIERSLNGIDYEEIGRVQAAGNSNSLKAYALVDRNPVLDRPAYYRLLPSNKALRSITVPVIGYRYRKDHIENLPAEEAEIKFKEGISNTPDGKQ